MKNVFAIVALLLTAAASVFAQEPEAELPQEKEYLYVDPSVHGLSMQEALSRGRKTGYRSCFVPMVMYGQQTGLTGSFSAAFYDFGDGHAYPDYEQMVFAEAAYSSLNAGLIRGYYSTKSLLKGYKLDFDVTYRPEAMYDFVGFNGYQSNYNPYLISPYFSEHYYRTDNPRYISNSFYKMKRDMLRVAADIRGTIKPEYNLYWNAGLGLQYYSVGHVDVARYNKNKPPIHQMADTVTLYDNYVAWNLIGAEESRGGMHPYLRAGATFDTRDFESNPQQGMYGDLFLTYSAAWGDLVQFNNLKLNLNWKHYLPLWDNVVNFAYLVGGQFTLAGKSPFYQNGTINQMTLQRDMYDGMGGANLPRGILRNRVLGSGFSYMSAELRVNVAKFRVANELLVLSVNPFVDEVNVVQPYDLSSVKGNAAADPHFLYERSAYLPHFSTGIGFRLTTMRNFSASLDWAVPVKEQDNDHLMNLYFTVGYMF